MQARRPAPGFSPVGVAGPSLARAYGGVRGLPTSFLIDRKGRIRHTVTGIFAEPALRASQTTP